MFKPTIWNSLVPILLIALSLVPIQFLRVILFGALAVPLGSAIGSFYYVDKQFLTPTGAFLVAITWAAVYYFAASILASMLRNGVGRR